jgi:hypothetical protein
LLVQSGFAQRLAGIAFQFCRETKSNECLAMATPIEVGALWGYWSKAKQGFGFLRRRFEKFAALEARVAALEAALSRCPGEACPFCGIREWRLKDVMMRGEMEVWQCGECKKEREYRYDLPGQLPPGVNPNRAVRPKR